MNATDDQLQEWVRAALEGDLDAPDAFLAARLQAIRLQALERTRSRRWSYESLLPLGTATAAIVVALSFMLSRPAPIEAVPLALELIAANQDMDLVEDLDFYEWLASRDHAG